MFDVRTEAGMSEWLQDGPAGSRAYLALPENGRGPGVLVLHAWWGLTHDFTDICDRLAAAGYVALAPSLYAGNATATTIAEAEALRDTHDEEAEAGPVAHVSVTQLLEMPAVTSSTVATIGFSMGAYWALHLSQAMPEAISATVAVYGTDDGEYQTAQAAYLGHFAENDPYESLEWVQDLEARIRAAGREVTFYTYPGTSHWFIEPSQPAAYNAAAADLVWQRTLAFLKTHLA
jgi:carboxymethylenebutenolidase